MTATEIAVIHAATSGMSGLQVFRRGRDGTLRVDRRAVTVDVIRMALAHELVRSTLAHVVAN